LLKYKGLDCI